MADDFDLWILDFEKPVRTSPPPPKKKKKLIGLDDLLMDYEKDQKRLNERKSKKKIQKASDAEDDDATEAKLSECVDKCQKEINQINGDEEMPFWGIQVFGDQGKLPQQSYPDVKSAALLQSFVKHKINSLVELNIEEGETFLEGLLVDGWLLHLFRASGSVEKSVATWTFNLMLYSSKVWLMDAACEFWCAILSTKDKANSSHIKINWLPRYSDLERALQAYGFLLDSSSKCPSDIHMVSADSATAGPPQNIRSWIKFIGFCCKARDAKIIISTQEAEDLLFVILSLFLDRQLLGLSTILHEALLSTINFFRDDEWSESCEKIATSLPSRLPCNINCLRVVESIVGVDDRTKQLRSTVAFHFLVTSVGKKDCNAEKILRLLNLINVKDKNCDLLRMYIYLSLAENWILFDTTLKDSEVIRELWGTCLRNCSSGIPITDLRSYASNVRSKASYLLQGNTSS